MSSEERGTRRQRAAAGLRTSRARFRALDRRDRMALYVWFALALALAPLAIGAPGRMHASEVVVPGTESAKAQVLAERAFGQEYGHLVLLQGPKRTLDRRGPGIAKRIAKLPEHRVLNPWQAGGSALRPARDKAILIVGIRKSFDDAGPAATRLREKLRREVKPPMTAHLTGFADLNRSIKDETVKAMELCELLAAPLLVLILILVLGSPIAASMPLVLGGCVAVMQIGTVDLINRYVTDLEVTAVAVGMAMSLALGVDYALLMVARFRSELNAGADVREAAAIAAAQAGRTVKLAAIVLSFAMTAATIATPASVLKSATIGVLTAVAFSVLGATFALPPLLRWAGRDINRYQVVSPGAESNRWSGIALAVLRRPVVAAVVVLGVMLALAVPALSLETGPPDPRILPKDDPARADFDVIEREIGASQSMPFVVTVVANRGTLADERLDDLARFERTIARDPDTAAVLGPATVARRTAPLGSAPGKLKKASAAVREGRKGATALEGGLARAAGGADALIAGLSTAARGARQLDAGGRRAETAVEQLDAGMAQARSGAAALSGGLARGLTAAKELDRGAEQAGDGAEEIARNLARVERRTREAAAGATKLASGLEQGGRDLRKLREPADKATAQSAEAFAALRQMLPTSQLDPNYERAAKAAGTTNGLLTGKDPVTGAPLEPGYPGLSEALEQAAAKADEAAAGARELSRLGELADGLGKLSDGADELADGVGKLAAGNRALTDGVRQTLAGARQLEDGLERLSQGTDRLLDGVEELNGGTGRLARELGAGADRTAPLGIGLRSLQGGAKEFSERAAGIEGDLGGIGQLSRVLRSGYATIAAIESAPREERDAAGWAINWDRGGNAVQYLVAQDASYGEGASAKGIPSRAGSPYRAKLERRVDRLAERVDAKAGVGGSQASIADFDQAAKDSLPLLVIVLIVATYVALVFVLRSLILPFIAVVLNVLTLMAAFGVIALAFGPDPLLGGPGFVDDIMVMVVYTVTFALSIDYAVFLLDRMREGWDRFRTVDGAITYGIESTAGVITGAAVIMAAVFIGFLLSPVVSLRQLGLALSVAVILDATLIRLVLLPAALRMAGERAWHTPRWLERFGRRDEAPTAVHVPVPAPAEAVR